MRNITVTWMECRGGSGIQLIKRELVVAVGGDPDVKLSMTQQITLSEAEAGALCSELTKKINMTYPEREHNR